MKHLPTIIALAAFAAPHVEPEPDTRELVIVSPNDRFEMRLVAHDDGCYIVQRDKIKEDVAVMSVMADGGASVQVGHEDLIVEHSYRAAMKSRGGFFEWGKPADIRP